MTHQDQLTVGGRHVATLTVVGGDFPWARGTYVAGPDEALLSSFLADRPDGRRELDLDRLAAAGHGPETVMLDAETYLHALVVALDGAASWRIGVDPLELGPEL